MSNLELNHVYKMYPNGVKAVNDFTMKIEDKEFIVFVGPSGCGKSTTLRMIAGLEDITSGEIKIDDLVVNGAEPKERDIAMVFQNYALYPHMTVYNNMAFGLKLRHMPKAEIDQKVRAAAEILGISDYLDRKPKALSGGQRQRVALGRAIVREPKVFLLDEPLSNLDAKLRAQMRSEISKLHKKLGTTFIYVTHDQIEAMTMGTRIVVMKDGFVQQIDTPKNLYRYPDNKFVAGFIGTPQMNFLNVRLKKLDSKIVQIIFQDASLSIDAPIDLFSRVDQSYLTGEKDVILGIRAEHISSDKNKYPFRVKCRVSHIEDLGVDAQAYADINLENEQIIGESKTRIIFKAETGYQTDEEVTEVSLSLDNMHLFDAENEESISPRLPKVVKTKGNVNNHVLTIFASKIKLPKALEDIPDGDYDVEIPTNAIALGSTINAKIAHINATTEKNIFTARHDEEYLFFVDELNSKLNVNDEVKLDIDIKQITISNESFIKNPLSMTNSINGIVERYDVEVSHVNAKGKEIKIKESYCDVIINEYHFHTSASLGLKLINLKENKAFKDEIGVTFTPYDAYLAEEGLPAKVINLFDYGNEVFVECELESGEKFIILNNKESQVGDEVLIDINTNKIQAFNLKNNIRLL